MTDCSKQSKDYSNWQCYLEFCNVHVGLGNS